MPATRLTTAVLAALLCMATGGCGAGLITGAVASNRNGTTPPPAVPPSLSLPETVFPLVPSDAGLATVRTVLVSNVRLEGALKVQLRAAGIAVDQGNPVIVSGQGSTTVVGFQLVVAPIVAAIGDPTAADVPATLAVLQNGAEAATPVPVVLAKQPIAALAQPAQAARLFLSPLGGTVARLLLQGLRADRAENLEVLVSIADRTDPSALVTRPCTGLTVEPAPGGGHYVAAVVPGNDFPGQVSLVVQDAFAGRSTAVLDAFYGPDVAVALPRQGPTTGGSLVTLIGTAMVPLDLSQQPAQPVFSQVEVLFRKGDREVQLQPQDLRTAVSGLDRLVFTMPASPDGRPGQVDIVLRLTGDVQAEVVATEKFLYANPQPVFGPRGALLDQRPVSVAPIGLEGAPLGGDATDLAVLYAEGGVAWLQMLLAEENGMFIRGSAPRRLGNPEIPAERDPADICTGDFDGDQVPDLFIVDQGSGSAVHHIVLGQSKPLPPLGGAFQLLGDPGNTVCRAADFDGDGLDDLLLVPGPGAPVGQLPQVYLARPVAGTPGFIRVADLPVQAAAFTAVVVGRIDADNTIDVALLSGGAQPTFDAAFGNGDGSFGGAQHLALAVPGQIPTQAVHAVGLHVMGATAPHPLVAVLAGEANSATTPSVLAIVAPDAQGVYQQPIDVWPWTLEPLGVSFATNLDFTDPEPELLIARQGDVEQPFLLFDWVAGRLALIPNGVESGAERLLSVSMMSGGIAFPTTPVARGVFVVHDSETDGVRERRVSTLLVGQLKLFAPDLGGQLAVEARGVLGGVFSDTSVANHGATKDLALAGPDGGSQIDKVDVRLNDGFGGFFGVGPQQLPASGLLPETLALARVTPHTLGSDPRFRGKDALAWFSTDGRLNVWEPVQGATTTPLASADLRLLAADPALRALPVSPRSRIASVDIDGDGVLDLVGLLSFDVQPEPREGDAMLVLLRGKPAPANGEFPFQEPTAAMPVHGNATSFTVADFAPDSSSAPQQLELALAVPIGTTPGSGDGDHVRFYRYAAGASPAADRFVRSASPGGAQVLLCGSAPTRLAAADFDGNGIVDLLVASQGDAALHLFLNNGTPASSPLEVNLDAFQESLASPVAAAPGRPTRLLIGDINGDGNVDALLSTESLANNVRSTAVAFFLSSGTGAFDTPVFVSSTRIGSNDAEHLDARLSIDLADVNADGVLDLAVAWNTSGFGDRNVRVLFGGSR